jgi:hypothetical protein
MNDLADYLKQQATRLATEMAASHSVWADTLFPPATPRTFTPTKVTDAILTESDGPDPLPTNFWKFQKVWAQGGPEALAKRAAEQGLASGSPLAKGTTHTERDGDWQYVYEEDNLVQQIDMRTGDRYDDKGEFRTKHALLAKNSDPPPKHEGALAKIFATEDPRDEITPWSVQAGRRR